MDKKSIVIIGMMGAGKSQTSRQLSKLLKRKVVSTDQLIEQKEGRKIAEIFSEKGEAYFRQLERAVVKEIAAQQNIIVDCGGGIVLNQENIDDLKRHGILIHLAVSPEWVSRRVGNARNRPLLDTENPQAKIEELIVQRAPQYAQAHYTIDTDGKTVDQVCKEVIDLLRHD